MIFEILLFATGISLILLGLVGIFAPVLPGPPLLFLGILCVAWADHFQRLNATELLILGIAAAIVTLLDFLAGIYGAKWFGGTRWGMLGATLGLFFGMFFGLIGLLLGPFIGVVIFEYWKQPDTRKAIRAGTGSLIGFILGTVLKMALSLVIIGVAIWWAFE